MSGIFKKFKSGDKKITSHDAHKLYTVNVSNHTGSYVEAGYAQKRVVDNVEVDVDLAVFSYDSLYDGSKFEPDTYDVGGSVLEISPHARTTNGLFKRSLHDSIQSMYYTDSTNPANTQHNIGFEKEYRSLHSRAQILSVPQVMMGSGIVKESVIITSGSIVLTDDGFGNLIDTTLTTLSVDRKDVALDLNFDPLYNQVDKKILSAYSLNSLADGNDELPLDNKVRFFDESNYANKVVARNFIPRSAAFGTYIEFNGIAQATGENRADLKLQSLFRVRHDDQFDYRDGENFSILLRVSSSGTDQPSKDVVTDGGIYSDVISKSQNVNSGRYPYSISYINDNSSVVADRGKYRLKVSGKNKKKSVFTSVVPFADSDGFTTLAVIKNGSIITFYWRTTAGAVANTTINLTDMGDISNKAPIIIGARAVWKGKYKKKTKRGDYSTRKKPRIEYYRHFKGGIGDLTIYRTALPTTYLSNIMLDIDTSGTDNKVGNVFYNHGIITLTGKSQRYRQGPRSSTFADCNLIFENSHQIVEQEYTCQIKEQEYGFTLNPTIIKPGKGNEIKDFVAGSEWSPYITTIGLYDRNARLLAIGKLAQPIKKSTKYDTTFVVRFDS